MCMSECVRTCVRARSFEVDVIESRAYDICEKSNCTCVSLCSLR